MTDRKAREINRIDEEARKTVQRMNDRLVKIDKKAAMRGLERSEENIKASKALIVRTLHIKSIKVLEAILANKQEQASPELNLKPYIAMYVYYAKHDKVNKIFYPNLYKAMKEYEAALTNASKNDPYYEVFKIMEYRRDRKQNANEFAIEAVYYINKIIERDGISINQLAEAAGLKYANVYNMLKKPEKMGCLSVRNTHKLLWIASAFHEGWTREEALMKHDEKMKELWLHWHVDIDLTDLKEEGE